MEYPHSEISERWSALSRTEYPHSKVLERWSAPFLNGIPTLRCFGKMECTFLNRIPTLRGFGKMEYTFLEQNTHTPRFQKNAVHPSPFGSVHQTILGSPLSSFGSSQEQPVCCSCLAPQSLLNRSPPFSLDTYHMILYSQTHSGLSEAQFMST